MENCLRFQSYLQDAAKQCDRRILDLNNDFRKDEGDMVKIRRNVLDIFQKMFDIAVKKAENEDEANRAAALQACFLDKLHTIPENWKKSLQLAREHDNARKIMEEEVKLNTVDEIEKVFKQIFEEKERQGDIHDRNRSN